MTKARKIEIEKSLFEILAKSRHRELIEGITWPSSNEEKTQIERAYQKQFEWEEVCDNEYRILGQELVREIYWALEGMEFAIDRIAALHFKNFHKFVGKIDPRHFVSDQLNWPTLSRSELSAYRATLMLFNATEAYFWIGAVWDRMGQFLNLFAFDARNVAESKLGWRQIFKLFTHKFGDVPEVEGSEDYQTIVRLHDKVYEKAYARRNILAHKGSLAGRLRIAMEANSEAKQLLWQFVMGKESWDLADVLGEVIALAGGCQEAVSALQRFVSDFVSWRTAAALES
jgi:hypothetical protein